MEQEQRQAFNDMIRSIFIDGKIKRIKWGAESDTEGWAVWDDRKRLEFAMELASAMNQAAEVMQKERDKLLADNAALRALNEQADKAVGINKNNLINAITAHNDARQSDAKEIARLVNELKEAKAKIKDLEARII